MMQGSLTVVSNRLPITIDSTGDSPRLQPSCGGLVSALLPILRATGGCWVGWTGTDHDDAVVRSLIHSSARTNCSFGPVFLTAAERTDYYRGFSNEIIWPLFHCLPSRCRFESSYWHGYCKVNGKFAQVVQRLPQKSDFIWVHDYHLMFLAHALRSLGVTETLGYFHHIPFPPPDIYETLPWRAELLRALLHFDELNFQTSRDRRNFIACLERCLPEIRVRQTGETLSVHADGRSVSLGAYPISVDHEHLTAQAAEPTVVRSAANIQSNLGHTQIVLGIDRLDYTKGIPERLAGFETFLKRNPDLRGLLTMIQIVVPSREDIPEYAQLKLQIEAQISRINGEYGHPGWTPIHYYHRCLSQKELLAFYRAAHIALITPLRDGMNLVAKEFCAARADNRGVLILSEFAGAAEELKGGALLVNPYDAETVALTLEQALHMGEAEQRMRMEKMRRQIRSHDIFHWFKCSVRRSEAWANASPALAAAVL